MTVGKCLAMMLLIIVRVCCCVEVRCGEKLRREK